LLAFARGAGTKSGTAPVAEGVPTRLRFHVCWESCLDSFPGLHPHELRDIEWGTGLRRARS
jgi:hypothetical protein